MRNKRVRVIRQLAASDCGAACLAMVLSHHGRVTGLSDARRLVPASRDGTTAAAIARAAGAEGLDHQGSLVNDLDLLATLPTPAILHWDGDHFVVLERVHPSGKVTIVDPATGRMDLTRSDLADHFTGVCLTFAPTDAFEPRTRRGQPLWTRFIRLVRGSPNLGRHLTTTFVLSAIIQLLALLVPIVTWRIVDHAVPDSGTSQLTALVAIAAAVIAADLVARLVRGITVERVRAGINRHLSSDFLGHMLKLPPSYFEQHASGDLLMRLGSMGHLHEIFSEQIVITLVDLTFLVVYLAVLAFVAPWFAVIIGGTLVVALGSSLLIAPAVHRRRQLEVGRQSLEQSYAVQTLRGMATIKVSGAEQAMHEHWRILYDRYLDAALQRGKLTVIMSAIPATVRSAATVTLLAVGAHQVIDGSVELGVMLGLVSLAGYAITPALNITSSGQQVHLAAAHIERLLEVYDTPPEDNETGDDIEVANADLRFDHVSFWHDPDLPPVLDDVSFHCPAGSMTAIVGATGSGKSTLIKLLVGVASPTSGSIIVGGHPIDNFTPTSLRRQLGVVLQEPMLISGNIRDNIDLGREQVPSERLVDAARRAGLLDTITGLPGGFQTLVGESGSGLSGGQRQRVSLARALIRDPKVLVLDEATSQLDAITERSISDALAELDCTRLVVAHRLSTVRRADQILVLDRGQIVEAGTHVELVERNGAYARLMEAQLP